MNAGEVANAVRRALNVFDEWNDVAGVVPPNTSWYYEMQSVVEDAVHCGIQAALGVRTPLPSELDDEGGDGMTDYMKEAERLTDEQIKALLNEIEYGNMVTFDDYAYLIARKIEWHVRGIVLAHIQRGAPAPAEVPMPQGYVERPSDYTGDIWIESQMRAYGAAREAAGYERGRQEADKLAHTLVMCRETFKKYADLHAAKGTDDGHAKAAANMRIVDICDAALLGEVKP